MLLMAIAFRKLFSSTLSSALTEKAGTSNNHVTKKSQQSRKAPAHKQASRCITAGLAKNVIPF